MEHLPVSLLSLFASPPLVVSAKVLAFVELAPLVDVAPPLTGMYRP